MSTDFFEEFPSAVTICDALGTIIYMNRKSRQTFEKVGSESLLGESLYKCHSEASVLKIREILRTGHSNSYTISKAGVRKLIHQSPWYKDGKIAGIIEMSILIPDEMPHFDRPTS